MKLFVGLGNPEKKYENTRHNLGQIIITNFIKKNNLNFKNYSKLSAQIAEKKSLDNNKNLFTITNEYMNNSGIAVKKIADYFKIQPQDIFIIHDDLDLPIGEYKIQFDRGPAGHNGIKSIIEHLHTQAFNRIRIGIGKPQNNIPVEDYVLQPFSKEDQKIISKIINDLSSTIDNLTAGL
jgi:peptidyl-tRNA hydrolase, PTH1 family